MWSKKGADTIIRGLPFYINKDIFCQAKRKQKAGYIISLVLVILMLCVIFRFSAADATQSSHLSEGICIRLVRKLSTAFPGKFPTQKVVKIAALIEYPVRKCAHFTEYAILSITVNFHLWICWHMKKNKESGSEVSMWNFLLWAELFCALYACSDELHQYFVPGRSCRFFDVCVDSTGAFCGALLFWGVIRYCYSRRKRQEIYRIDEC